MPVRNKAHEKLKDDLLFDFGSQSDVRVWVRDVGYDERIHLSYGIAGECDIDGIWGPFGVRIGIEVKTGSGKLSVKQERWKAMILKFGGIYIEARSREQALQEFEYKKAEWLLNYQNRLAKWKSEK